MDILWTALAWIGTVIFVSGLAKMTVVPFAIAFERERSLRRRGLRGRHRWDLLGQRPTVSVIVPGYNEGPVIRNCVRSIVVSEYPVSEVILVDDGSTDDTAAIMTELAAQFEIVRVIAQVNGGKGSALNAGAKSASGEILMFVDADGIFTGTTVAEMLRGFDHPRIGAVCGDDRPVNLDRVQTQLLAILSHVGTGLVRRALAMIRSLPIVSGNIGAFRRDVLEATGMLRTDTLGEDLELTWRVHKAGYLVNFAPRALVYAESPSTLRGLWKQRVRWARGLLQTIRLHKGMIGNPRYGIFGPFLVFNTFSMVVMPLLQLAILICVPILAFGGYSAVPVDIIGLLGWLGLFISLVLVVVSTGINRAWSDLRFLWTVPLWPLYSVFTGLTMVSALIKEVRGEPAAWNKLHRTGVVSAANARNALGGGTP